MTDFSYPPSAAGSGYYIEFTSVMAMPKTSMDKYHCPAPWKNQVRCPWQFSNVKLVSEAFVEKISSDEEFWFRVFALDHRHVVASCFFIVDIKHTKPSFSGLRNRLH